MDVEHLIERVEGVVVTVLGAPMELDEVEDLHRLPAADVLELLGGLLVERNRLDAQIAGLVRYAELTQAAEHDGLASMRSWLIGHQRLSAAEASRVVRAARLLAHVPHLAAAFPWSAVAQLAVAVALAVVLHRLRIRTGPWPVSAASCASRWARRCRQPCGA